LMLVCYFIGDATTRLVIQIWDPQGFEWCLQLSLLLRVVRILDFPCFRHHSALLWRAISAAAPNLVVPLAFAGYVWILSACAFMWTEVFYDGIAQREFTSVPAAMYWTSIFMVGEWGVVDFSSGAGSRLCIFYCVFAIMVFAIPVGIIGEAMQSTLIQVTQEQAKLEDLVEMEKRLERLFPTSSDSRRGSAKANSLTRPVAAGMKEVQVASTDGFVKVGHEVIIDAGTSQEEVNEIAAFEFDSLLLVHPLQFDHDEGATISANTISGTSDPANYEVRKPPHWGPTKAELGVKDRPAKEEAARGTHKRTSNPNIDL